MSFIYPALLGGLILAGIPVLLHLIMRQKPKHLVFPAFRFLLQRHRANQRKLRLRHLVLLALRLFLIVGLCLALARPRVISPGLNLATDRPVAAVLIFDTSPSMGYKVAGQSRLDEAKQRAQELLDELPADSRIAVLDTADLGGEWLPSLSLVRDRVANLSLRPANNPVTSRLAEAYRLFLDLEQEAETADESLPRFLYIFSDRTLDSWDTSRIKDLQQARDRLSTPVHAIFIDVGVENPVDVALAGAELPRQIVPTGDKVQIKVTVRSTGADCDTEVWCKIHKAGTEDKAPPDRQPVKLGAGQSKVLTFEREGLKPGPYHAELSLPTEDALSFNNQAYATFEVRGGRRVLTLVDRPEDATIWQLALESNHFQCDVRPIVDVGEWGRQDLQPYQAIALLGVAAPKADVWAKLKAYVSQGGGLAVVPGGEAETDRHAYNDNPNAQELLPGQLIKVVKAEKESGAIWNNLNYQHPLMARFREWDQSENIDFLKIPRGAFRYWEVKPYPEHFFVLVSYDEKQRDGKLPPALLERNFDTKRKRPGRVLLYTTPLDNRHLDPRAPWNNYNQLSSFYFVLVNHTVGYLAGDAEEADLNHLCGQPVTVLPPAGSQGPYPLQGPGLNAADALVPRGEGQTELTLPQAVAPGNYTLFAAGTPAKPVAWFSLNVPPGESQLSRVPPEQIEELLGPGALLPVGHGVNFHDALQGHWDQPVELLPWLMILVLLVLAVENLLANKFYRREMPEGEEPAAAPAAPALQPEEPAEY